MTKPIKFLNRIVIHIFKGLIDMVCTVQRRHYKRKHMELLKMTPHGRNSPGDFLLQRNVIRLLPDLSRETKYMICHAKLN